MTRLMEEAIRAIKALPESEQDAIAAVILAEIEDERRWTDAFARSPDLLSRLAGEALAEHRERLRPREFGSARGLVHMADDFDAPLEEFKS